MAVLSLGISYRRAPVSLLERLSFGDEDYAKAYRHLSQLESVHEGVILSTCNRVEVYGEVTHYHQGFQDLKRFLAESREVAYEDFAEPLYSHYEDDAAEHLFSVAAGLDSMVLGEPQVLGQVRAAVRRARAEAAAGPAMSALFDQSVRAGRRARSETAIGASPAAFVDAGADLAEKYLGGLNGRSIVVVGAGTMGALATRRLVDRGAGDVLVLGRRPDRARRVAEKVGARAGGLDAVDEGLAGADMVVSSTAATGIVIGLDSVTQRADGGRRLFVLDLAVPRDVDPGVRELPGVRLCDIDDLRDIVAGGGSGTAREVARASAIVREETRRYAARRREARLAPLIEALHERGEEVRAAEIRRLASRLAALSEADRRAVDAATRRIVRRLLHDPVTRLKDLAGRGLDDPHAQALAELFGLDLPDV
jgi:glutamyl-tRNA reductase